jgi:hypothetical protein
MAVYKNITGELTQELLAVGSSTNPSSISLTNIHATNECRVDLYIEKKLTGKFYLIKGVSLPLGATSDTALTLYFKSMLRGSGNEGAADALANLDNNDSVTLTISANTHLVAIRAIIDAINNPNLPSVIVVANDDSGGTEYLSGSGVSACGTISVAAAYTN